MGRSVSPPDAGGRRCGGALARLALGLALILVAGSALAQSAATPGSGGAQPRQARRRGQRARLRQGPQHGLRRRRRRALLQAPGAAGGPGRLRPHDQAPLRRGSRQADRREGQRHLRQAVRSHRRFRRRLRRGRRVGQHRPHPLHVAAHRALGGRGDGVQQRRLHRLRALQSPSGAAAAVAGPRREDHREPADARRLLRGRVARSRRRAGRLYPLFLRARSDGDPPERPARADLHPQQLRSASASACRIFSTSRPITI